MSDRKLAPLEWAEVLKLFKPAGKRPEAVRVPSRQYAVCDYLYGWSQQAYHYGPASFLLTQAEFEKAMSRPDAKNLYPAAVAPCVLARRKVKKPAGKPKGDS